MIGTFPGEYFFVVYMSTKERGGPLLVAAAAPPSEQSLSESTLGLQQLTAKLIRTQEEQLRWLSREHHDDLTQRLAVLAIEAGVLEKTLMPLQPQASQELTALKTGLIEVSDAVHNLSRQLHPSIIDDLGLVQAIQAEFNTFSRRTGIDIFFEPGSNSVTISPLLALNQKCVDASLEKIAASPV